MVDKVVPAAAALVACLALAFWLSGGDAEPVEPRVPTPEKRRTPADTPVRPIAETWKLQKGDGTAAALPWGWPRFRGANFDALAPAQPELARTWPESGPPVLWSVKLGEGHAGPAVLSGRVYILDYDEPARRDTLRCLSLADGKEIWRFSYAVDIKRMYGMSRTVPAVTDKFAVSIGPLCHVTCVDSATGQYRWSLDLVREFGASVPSWYAGQCPLIDRGRAVIAVGGPDVLMMAVECDSGKIAWKAPNPRNWKMTHSSVIPTDFGGRRAYVYAASGGVIAASADDGRTLWETTAWWVPMANVPSPVIIGDGRIFLTGGYGAGSLMLRLQARGEALAALPEWRIKEQVFGAEQHTPILYNGHIYGVATTGQLACLDLSGNVLWSSGRSKTFGRGPYLIANGLIYLLNSTTGHLTLAEATPDAYHELAQARIFQGPDVYGPMAVAGGLLLARDRTSIKCLDVRRK